MTVRLVNIKIFLLLGVQQIIGWSNVNTKVQFTAMIYNEELKLTTQLPAFLVQTQG